MTLNQIMYFQKVARLENYHQAAEELYISQPSLSRAIASLEKELGVSLFEKKGRGVGLTKAGRMFLEYADRILDECNVATGKMWELSFGGGRIDIGYVFPLAGHYIPHMAKQFLAQRGNQNVLFNFWQNHTSAIAKKVRAGELDIGFGGWFEADDIEFFPLLSQEMVILTPEDHPLAGNDSIPLIELTRNPVIGYDRESWMGTHIQHLYRKYNLKPQTVAECPDEYSIMALVKEHFGIALMPRADLLESTKGVEIHRIQNLDIRHQIYMFWVKNRYRLPVADSFIDYMKAQAEPENDSKNALKIYLKDIVNL